MTLRLTIENHASLPDGGPISISAPPQRGLDIGRDRFLDWTLPDPSRYISGKHCEIRYQNGEFLLSDVSTNGTFLNGSQRRMQSPHRLRDGDRLTIGDYIIAVAVEEAAGEADASSRGGTQEYWAADGDIAPPVDPRSLRPPDAARPVHSDFLEQAMGSPDLYDAPRAAPPSFDPFAEPAPSAASDFDWAPEVPRVAPVVEPAPAAPSPRRASSPAPAGLWSDEPAPLPPAPVAAASLPPATPLVLPSETAPVSPLETAPPPPLPSPAPPTALPPDADAFVARFAAAAGLPASSLAGQDGMALAHQAGAMLRAVVVEMMQLLSARNEARRLARSAHQTVIQALDNNPLKFSPTPEEALRILLGPPTKSYLDAPRALAQGFGDLKAHQVKTYSAMQAAIRAIAQELDPATIEKALPPSSGLAEMIGSRKARLWDAYVAHWRAATGRHDDGLVDVFMLNFTDSYDRGPDGEH